MADIGMENGDYSNHENDYDPEEALAREMERECDDRSDDDESSQNNFGPPHSGSGGPDGPGLLGPGGYGSPNFGPPGPWGRGFPPRGPRYDADEFLILCNYYIIDIFNMRIRSVSV